MSSVEETVAAARAAARGAGWAPWPAARVSEVSGADAAALLSRLSSQDLGPLEKGRGVTTVFLDSDGRVLHRVLVQPLGAGRGLRAVSESAPGPNLADWVERYTFAEDCRWSPAEGQQALLVLGPGAVEVAAGAGFGRLESDGEQAAREQLLASRRPFGPLPSLVVSGPREQLAALGADLTAAGAASLDPDALEQLRIECGVPAAGAELDGERHLLEAGLRADASFEKGCYTGQEVVARQDTYDKVVRRLVGLVFDGRPEAGEELVSEEKRGCAVTSVAPAPAEPGDPGPACLGFVRSRHAVAGREVRTAAGLPGRVVELPFPSLRAGSPDRG